MKKLNKSVLATAIWLVMLSPAQAQQSTTAPDFNYGTRGAVRPAMIFNDGANTWIQPAPGQTIVVHDVTSYPSGIYQVVVGLPDVIQVSINGQRAEISRIGGTSLGKSLAPKQLPLEEAFAGREISPPTISTVQALPDPRKDIVTQTPFYSVEPLKLFFHKGQATLTDAQKDVIAKALAPVKGRDVNATIAGSKLTDKQVSGLSASARKTLNAVGMGEVVMRFMPSAGPAGLTVQVLDSSKSVTVTPQAQGEPIVIEASSMSDRAGQENSPVAMVLPSRGASSDGTHLATVPAIKITTVGKVQRAEVTVPAVSDVSPPELRKDTGAISVPEPPKVEKPKPVLKMDVKEGEFLSVAIKEFMAHHGRTVLWNLGTKDYVFRSERTYEGAKIEDVIRQVLNDFGLVGTIDKTLFAISQE